MSLRTDSYLSFCFEQAQKSPLHFRHGCIIVRGGKVIGQGYNTYRPGFDGGALKHGNMVGGLNGLSMQEFKQHLDQKKPICKSEPSDERVGSPFTPFESLVGGHHLNAPLSMHSEMMAIQSALSLSSAAQASQKSARSAKWLQKPCLKLSSELAIFESSESVYVPRFFALYRVDNARQVPHSPKFKIISSMSVVWMIFIRFPMYPWLSSLPTSSILYKMIEACGFYL